MKKENNLIRKIIKEHGKFFILNPSWKYHYTKENDDIVNIFKYVIMSKRRLIESGFKEFENYYSSNGMDNISLTIKDNYIDLFFSSYRYLIENNDAIIVKSNVSVISYKSYIIPSKGIRKLFSKTILRKEPISSFIDEVQVKDIIEPNQLLGIKIGEDEISTLNLVNKLVENNISVKLYDLKTHKAINSDELVKRLSLR